MTASMDRQGILDNLTAIETTAKLLVNAFATTSTSRPDLSLNGVHRQELVAQTTTFLTQAQSLIVDLSNTFNLSTDTSQFPKSPHDKRTETKKPAAPTPHATQNGENHSTELKAHPPKKSYPLSSVTLDDIVQNRLSVKQLFPHYPLLRDPAQPNLIALARSIRPIDHLDDVMLKIYAKIFNQEERLCCNYDGNQNKLPYPPTKRLLADLMLKLLLDERQKVIDDNERRSLYLQCEKHSLADTPSDNYRGLNIDHCDENLSNVDEKQLICTLVRRVVASEDIKRIVSAKQDQTSQWNTNEICIYYARPLHLLWIKQKWLERYPTVEGGVASEEQRWAQCVNWAIDSMMERTKVRPSKRKTVELSTGDRQPAKAPLTFEEKCQCIDRTKFDVFEYASELLQLLATENDKQLPMLEQLQTLECLISRFYWTSNPQQTWSQILDAISSMFPHEWPDSHFRLFYSKKLLEANEHAQVDIDRLLQIV